MKDLFNEALQWRYATKKFNPHKKVASGDVEILKESIRLSASAYGLQPYEVIIIENKAFRKNLQAAAYNQAQVVDASHLFVFASYTAITEEHILKYLENISQVREIEITSLAGFKDMLYNTVLKMSPLEQKTWAAKQTYLAVGNFLSSAASLRIDTCPMEGFEVSKVDNILDLEKKGLTSTVIVPIGYRSAEDKVQFQPKVRKQKEQLFQLI